MKIEMTINGIVYESEDTPDVTQEKMVDAIYDDFESLSKIKIKLVDGSTLITGKKAIQNSVIIIK